MTFIAPTGYSLTAMGHSPRSGQDATFDPPVKMDDNAVAGPSGSGQGHEQTLGPSIVNGATRNYADEIADSRRQSEEDMPVSPSSAPPNPSVISVTHPPEFIHTHHPRRGSLTPLGLNVISPIPPISMIHGNGPTHTPHSPVRSLGFTPTQAPGHGQPFPFSDAFPSQSGRRGSGASSSSTLTLSRPSQLGVASNTGRDRRRSSLAPAFPIGFNPERRRSSLTPSIAQALPPSPTRTHASGVFGAPADTKRRRPGTSDGQGPPALHTRHHTSNGVRTLQQQQQANDARRGSMPQLHYGGWTGPKWNPSLPPQRGSVGDEALPDDDFKFGSVSANDKTPTQASAATFALKAIEISPSRRASKIRMDAFQEQEQEEAERQQRAFIAATYGADGRRARDRLSIGGPNAHAQLAPTPLNRRPSLMLWEKLGMAAAAKQFEPELAASSAPTLVLPSPLSEDEFGQRRGSLPIAIPYTGLGRSPSSRRGTNLDGELSVAEEGQSLSSEEGYERRDEFDSDHLAPIRPAPPLLPLSDPGPRLLPSTLALQRASHLLSSRNLQADPLPHPLPPSLHPPIPVDVTEFDIDFILAGSRAQLGGKRTTNAAIDDIAPFGMPTANTLKLGQDEEDSFAKFVGKFDDEYGGRRGDWTFRAKAPFTSGDGKHPRSVWESPGAGSYDVYANGEVRSEKTGTKGRTCRKGICEYELEYIAGLQHSSPTSRQRIGEKIILTTKYSHGEAGGRKSPTTTTVPGRNSLEPPRPFANRLRVSISEATRAMRLDSSDSGTTTKMSSSLPTWTNALVPAPHASTPSSTSSSKKNRRGSRDDELKQEKAQSSSSQSHHQHRIARIKSRERDDEKKKDKDKEKDKEKPGFFKRGIIAPFKNSIAQYEDKKAQKEERERERQQAHSWSGVSASPGWIHPSGKNTPPPMASPTESTPRAAAAAAAGGGSASSNTTATASSVRTSMSDDHSRPVFAASSSGGDSRRGSGSLNWRQGKAWGEVPEDAVAMVLDCGTGESCEDLNDETLSTSDPRQVLLVWYVPFNSEADDRDRERERERERTATTPATRSTLGSLDNNNVPPSSPTSSLPKFQKLLRRRASKDKEVLSRNSSQTQSQRSEDISTPRAPRHPLPFRSFRVVARLVDIDDLRSETDTPTPLPERKSPSPQPNSIPGPRPAAVSIDSAIPKPRLVTTHTNTTTSSSLSASTAPTSTILAGRTISTVIAVCHSRSQGVEFVLEGLDRLGYCVGESAWGPTGYEEWRGTGLSEKGRELLDLLWAGCTAVMGLAG